MKGALVLTIAALALVQADSNSKNSSTSSEPPPTVSSSSSPSSGVRVPRGTVYQIRPLKFQPGDSNPFEALDSIADIDFRKLKLKAENRQSENGGDNIQASSSNVKVVNYRGGDGVNDNEAVDSVAIPKYVLDAVNHPPRPPSKRDQKQEASYAVPVEIEQESDEPWDASYAFGYTLEDQARHEVSDPDGNIRGYYTYVDDEGVVRKVVYQAGAGTGFVVLNKQAIKGPSRPPRPPKRPSQVIVTGGGGGWNREPSGPPPPLPSTTTAPRPPSRPVTGYPSLIPAEDGYPGAGSGSRRAIPRRPVFVVKIRKPHQKREDADEEGQYREDSGEDNGQWDGDIGDGPRFLSRKSNGLQAEQSRNEPRPDPSYTFGYETDSSNRIEKADNYGNVRGSYSYIDEDGVKRTVHYVAGSTTGFQVLGTSPSPSASRSIRIEAPPGFAVSRRQAEEANNQRPSSLSPAESQFPPLGSPNVVVYHIHPDESPLNFPWWESLGLPKRPSRMRRITRIHRKRARTFARERDGNNDNKDNNNSDLLQQEQSQEPSSTEAPRPSSSSSRPILLRSLDSPEVIHTSSPRPIPTYVIRATPPSSSQEFHGSPSRSFRHSTKVNLDNIDMNTYFIRRRAKPSHRAFTREFQNSFESESNERFEQDRDRETPGNNPVLYSPSRDSVRIGRKVPIPNPIIYQPSKSKVSVRNRGIRFDVAESNIYPVRSTPPPSSPQFDNEIRNPIVTPTPNPVEIFAAGNPNRDDPPPPHSNSINPSTQKSMQLTISSSTTRIPYRLETPRGPKPHEKENIVLEDILKLKTNEENKNNDNSVPDSKDNNSSSSNTLALSESQFEHVGVMSSSARLMKRLGREIPQETEEDKPKLQS